jgi:predicted Zn-dependent protease with MMP-like domain
MECLDRLEAEKCEAFERFVEEFDRRMLSEPRAALRWVDEAAPELREESEWFICRAEALQSCDGPRRAAEFLARVVAEQPEFADAHYQLAMLYQELSCQELAIQHQLATLRLDSAPDAIVEPASEMLKSRIVEEAGLVLSSLAPGLREKVAAVPVFLQPRPSEDLVKEGVDPRSLGLFEGPNLAEAGSASLGVEPAAITLFVNCLMDAFGDDEEELLEEVRVTVLHEVGHYFCLSEDDLAELGLE